MADEYAGSGKVPRQQVHSILTGLLEEGIALPSSEAFRELCDSIPFARPEDLLEELIDRLRSRFAEIRTSASFLRELTGWESIREDRLFPFLRDGIWW